MKRGGPLRRRTPLRQVSLKRIGERPQRQAVIREVMFRDGPGCYASKVILARMEAALEHGWPTTCWHPPGETLLDAHEVIQRSVRPGGHLEADNVRMVCRRHHEWIDAHQVTAATLGLHGYSYDRPA